MVVKSLAPGAFKVIFKDAHVVLVVTTTTRRSKAGIRDISGGIFV